MMQQGALAPAMQQLQQRPQSLPIEMLGLTIGSRIEVGLCTTPLYSASRCLLCC